MKVVAAVAVALVFLTGVASAFTPARLRVVGELWIRGNDVERLVTVFDDVSRGVVCYSQTNAISCVKVTP